MVQRWEVTEALKGYRVAAFYQRDLVLGPYSAFQDLQVGACTGLSFEWAKRHKSNIGESPENRMKWMSRAELWRNDIVKTTQTFNGTQSSHVNYSEKIKAAGAPYGIDVNVSFLNGTPTKRSSEIDAIKNELASLREYYFIMLRFSNSTSNHLTAGYTDTIDEKSLRLFDPSFGEFLIRFGILRKFIDAWIKQYATYINKDGVETKLDINKIEVHRMKKVVGAGGLSP
jgi:hypothetical protein